MSHATIAPFAPSELVVLFGDRFAPEAGMLAGKEEVLTSGVKVHWMKLMDAALHAAIWTMHRGGAARLEVRQGKAMFGLIKTKKVHLVPGTGPASFPEHSLEHFLANGTTVEPELSTLIGEYIGKEMADPVAHVLGRIKAGMARRELLEIQEKKTLMVFTTAAFTLPESTRSLAGQQSTDAIKQMVEQAEKQDPELYQAVQKAIDNARVQMTEQRG